jgi:hypothetical protein
MNRRPLFTGAALLLAVITIAMIPRSTSKKSLLGQNNAVWGQSLYFRGYQPTTKEPLTEADLARFCDTLRQNGITYAYMFAGPYDTNGRLPEFAFSQTAISSVRTIQRCYPDLILLPWVGGIINKTVFIDNQQWVSNAVQETARLLKTLDVGGVHVNFEFFTYPIPDELFPDLRGIEHYGEDEIRFFQKLRSALPQAFVSAVVVSTAPQATHWKRKNTFDEIRDLSKFVNQIAILCFDTSIKEQTAFKKSLKHQLEDIRQWKAMPMARTQFLIGIGTFINKKELWGFRDLSVESIQNTLKTLNELIAEPPQSSTQLVDGLAIFAEWTTDEKEWKELRRLWLHQN